MHNPKPLTLEKDWGPDQTRFLTRIVDVTSKHHVLGDKTYSNMSSLLAKKVRENNTAYSTIEQNNEDEELISPRPDARATFIRQQHMKTAYRWNFAPDR